MSDQPGPAVDVGAIVAALRQQRVAFVAGGAMAAVWHGSVRITKDFDLCPAWTPGETVRRLALALEELDARLLVPDGSPKGIEVSLDGRFLLAMELSTWRTTAGDADVLLGIPDRRWRLSRFEHMQTASNRLRT